MLIKIFKFIGFVLLLVFVIFGILYYSYNEPMPTGKPGPEADALAYRMLEALNNEAYQKATIIEWSFRGGSHNYIWDKEKSVVKVAWNDYTVHLDLITPSSSSAYQNGEKVSYKKTVKLIDDAQSYFNNDSFWLIAPFKVFDVGTERYLVDLEDGSEGLLVTYTQGGDTPGDSYLWQLERSGIPKSFKLWVKIIPIGGLEATWEGWQQTKSGAFLPTSHSFGLMNMSMGTVRAYSEK